MAITIEAKHREIPLTIDVDKVHHATLHKEIDEAVGKRFSGVITRDNGLSALYQTTVEKEQFEAVVKELEGFETRLGPAHARETILADLRGKYDTKIVDLIENGLVSHYLAIFEALEKDRELPPEYTPEFCQRVMEIGPALRAAMVEFNQRIGAWDIRVMLREELRQKFPGRIIDLAIFTHPDGKVSAHVAWNGDVDEEHIKKIHATTAKHDHTKAPPEPKTEHEQIKDDVEELKAVVAQLKHAGILT